MIGSVHQRLKDSLRDATAAGRAIATYMLANLSELPFETSATIAHKVGVSELTVGRFCRVIGYRHFKDLKTDLKADIGSSPWLIGDRLREFQTRSRAGGGDLARSLELSIAATVRVYELAQTPSWKAVVHRLATVPQVFVAGFQTERGTAAIMVDQLRYLRDSVHLVDLAAGNFAEVLLTDPSRVALMLFDARRYSQHAPLLAQRARDAGVPVTLVTDQFCDWGHDCATEVLAVPTEIDLFWDSTAHMVLVIQLLLNGVFGELGLEVEERLNRMAELYNDLVGHVGRRPDR